MKPREIEKEDHELLKAIGLKIKTLRKEKKIGYVKLADDIGISRNALSLIENGRVYFNFSTLLQILKYFGLSTQEFFKEF